MQKHSGGAGAALQAQSPQISLQWMRAVARFTLRSNWQYPRENPGFQWSYYGVSSWQPLGYYFSSSCPMVNIYLSYHSISIEPQAKMWKSRFTWVFFSFRFSNNTYQFICWRYSTLSHIIIIRLSVAHFTSIQLIPRSISKKSNTSIVVVLSFFHKIFPPTTFPLIFY